MQLEEYKQSILMKRNQVLNKWGEMLKDRILDNMESGYGKPIRRSGALMGDVSAAKVGDDTIVVGNTLEYGPFVHEGTSKMPARHYIADELERSIPQLKQTALEILSGGEYNGDK